MKASVAIECFFPALSFEDKFEALHELGVTSIELWSWDDKNLDRIVALCTQYDIKITAMSGDKTYSLVDPTHYEAYISYIKLSIEAAKKLKCPVLVIHSNALADGVVVNSYDELSDYTMFGSMVKTLLALKPLAEEAGVILALEALNTIVDHEGNFLKSTKDAVEAVRLVDSDNIKILYDIYHMQIMEGNIIQTLRENIDFIGNIHIADVPGRHEPGTGELNYKGIFEALDQIGYTGHVGFELFPEEDSEKVIKENYVSETIYLSV